MLIYIKYHVKCFLIFTSGTSLLNQCRFYFSIWVTKYQAIHKVQVLHSGTYNYPVLWMCIMLSVPEMATNKLPQATSTFRDLHHLPRQSIQLTIPHCCRNVDCLNHGDFIFNCAARMQKGDLSKTSGTVQKYQWLRYKEL